MLVACWLTIGLAPDLGAQRGPTDRGRGESQLRADGGRRAVRARSRRAGRTGVRRVRHVDAADSGRRAVRDVPGGRRGVPESSCTAAGLTRDAGVVYAVGRLVIFAPKGSPLDGRRTARRARRGWSRPAGSTASRSRIPRSRPYGRAAEAVLRKRGLWDAMRPYLVLGDTIAQAAQFATTGNAVGGIIAYSLVLAPGLRRPRHVRASSPTRTIRRCASGWCC